jgi:hypothetical protein
MGDAMTGAPAPGGARDAGTMAASMTGSWVRAYTATVDGRRVDLGPHVALGSGSGAGFIARIYLHVADGNDPEVPRGIYVAVVGRHLPDTTT